MRDQTPGTTSRSGSAADRGVAAASTMLGLLPLGADRPAVSAGRDPSAAS
jgi:hypothetical protein